MERIPSAQPPPACLERSTSLSGMDFSHMYPVFKNRKGLKRCEDGKETYKLPHRLIEKKRRDRINECISQLKDLLPEHLKLTTLGHLEKAVVLELTLKHVQSLSNLIEQQQQQILTLQKGGSPLSSKSSEEMFRSGFQLCAEEALRFLQGGETRELVAHLHRVASDFSHSPSRVAKLDEKPSPKAQATNCVPVICRAAPLQSGEQSGTDTDTDSGYGGEVEKADSHQEQGGVIKEDSSGSPTLDRVIKQEHEEIPKKRPRLETTDGDSRFCNNDLSSVGSYPSHPPFCFPFYLIPPTPSAYLPMLEKCWYPGSMPMLYPNLSQSGLLSQDSVPQVHSPAMSSMDSSALLQALKQVPTVGADPKD
ncbi:class E basic helix-loop-helix protein 40 [Bufo gargarizans]|uniref:class E basic helix-loop-helix protein 40 n=1 Tax=Bufo gargarizans TaxID=30331 RepID=UPI001CF11EFE|nr:class E basic helix-loop-helix protein 40 [Bufo gargarizans]